MYKLVIADDEPVVRQGPSAVFDWATLGIELAGQADDGDTGLELIERIKPDIVLTDIMMPAMDGNRMAKAVREQLDFLGLKLPTKQPYLVPVATIDSAEVLVGRTERDRQLLLYAVLNVMQELIDRRAQGYAFENRTGEYVGIIQLDERVEMRETKLYALADAGRSDAQCLPSSMPIEKEGCLWTRCG
ncbi:response regulator [Cohnella zeiphila]|uniref:Response regulator n=1 Tax=Cohnella zeiphila TaxID=2761120 RepID=A0A7X0SRW6_9BACL|nr:response regulator [Cohnella zeiphila]MBB6734944.1 response regulator [Cohnella zeiphila]